MKKIVIIFVFVFAIASLSACKTTNSCSSVEKPVIDNNQTNVSLATEVTT